MKVFKLNDCDWYMAETLEEAIAAAIKDTGLSREELVDDPYELTEKQMNETIFDNQDGTKTTFAIQFKKRMEAGAKPSMFASTEY